MSFRLVPESVTWNDHEQRNDPYFELFHGIRHALLKFHSHSIEGATLFLRHHFLLHVKHLSK